MNWFNKTMIGQYPGRKFRLGSQTKNDGKEKGDLRAPGQTARWLY